MNLFNEAYTLMLIIFSRTNKMLMFKDPEEAVLKMGRSYKEGTDTKHRSWSKGRLLLTRYQQGLVALESALPHMICKLDC